MSYSGAQIKLAVFCGPSLAKAEAMSFATGYFLPPARFGDILLAQRLKPGAIVLIDGLFQTTAAVWHNEILAVLKAGIPVYGASSMGALRAAELHSFGMRGIGWIFEQFRDGGFCDDDEVAVSHFQEDRAYRTTSDALVNIRQTIAAARRKNQITEFEATAVISRAKATFHPQRIFRGLLQNVLSTTRDPQEAHELLSRLCSQGYVNQKEIDARQVLHVAMSEIKEKPKQAPAFELNESVFLRKLRGETLCRAFSESVIGLPNVEQGLAQLATDQQAFPLVQRLAILLAAIDAFAANSAAPAQMSYQEHRENQVLCWMSQREEERNLNRRLTMFHVFARALFSTFRLDTKQMQILVGLIARCWCHIDLEAELGGLSADAARQRRISDDFRSALGLRTASETYEWLQRQGLNEQRYRRFLIATERMHYVADSFNVQVLGCSCERKEPFHFLLAAANLSGLVAVGSNGEDQAGGQP